MLFDAILTWAYGVNLSLADGGTIDGGLNITNKIFNLTFEGRLISDKHNIIQKVVHIL